MSREAMWARIKMAWAMLSRPRGRDVHADREREARPAPRGDEPAFSTAGFAEEALPWLDAVYRFSLRLTQGDVDTAEDLVQETFLRAHRSWQTFERGSNAKSWLFTICRNSFLHERERMRSRKERPAADLDARIEDITAPPELATPTRDEEREFFDHLIDDDVVRAIDALPEDFRAVLVLSDLGDLRYAEIAEVLDIPLGTVRSRLFRARRILQDRLKDFAIDSGYLNA